MNYSLLVVLFAVSLFAQETKPRVFVSGRGTINAMSQGSGVAGFSNGVAYGSSRRDSIVDVHDESIELTKDLRQRCDGIIVTLKESAADYLVVLNRESKGKKGALAKNSQVLVADKSGDVIWTKDVRKVDSAAKDVCAVVLATAQATHTIPAQPASVANVTGTVAARPETQSSTECVQTATGACKK